MGKAPARKTGHTGSSFSPPSIYVSELRRKDAGGGPSFGFGHHADRTWFNLRILFLPDLASVQCIKRISSAIRAHTEKPGQLISVPRMADIITSEPVG